MIYCFESCKLIICMPTVYINQLKQHTQKKGEFVEVGKETRYDYNLTIMKSPKPATDNRFKK